ncbi:MAG: PAS domain-containing protein [Desulfurivibrionaceae bacterium]
MEKLNGSFYLQTFDYSPVGMAVYDYTGQCIAANRSICEMIGGGRDQVLAQNYHRINFWKTCGLLYTAEKAVSSGKPATQRVSAISSFGKALSAKASLLPLKINGSDYLLLTFDDLSEIKKVEDEREEAIRILSKALEEIKALRSILPLCSFCKKIRDDEGYWEQVDVYIPKHLPADITHSICPDCLETNYPELWEARSREKI